MYVVEQPTLGKGMLPSEASWPSAPCVFVPHHTPRSPRSMPYAACEPVVGPAAWSGIRTYKVVRSIRRPPARDPGRQAWAPSDVILHGMPASRLGAPASNACCEGCVWMVRIAMYLVTPQPWTSSRIGFGLAGHIGGGGALQGLENCRQAWGATY